MSPLRDAVHVTLGYFLDGHAWPGAFAASPQGGGAVEGALALGPLGLLGMLRTWLGLPDAPTPGGQRIAQCIKAARECSAASGRFYSASLETAPWATAQHLLALRDTLVLAGWRGERPKAKGGQGVGNLQRLRDMADLEVALPAMRGLPARLDALIKALEAWPLPQPLTLTLLEPLEGWPACWQRLLTALQQRGVPFALWKMPPITVETTNLAHVRQALLGQGAPDKPNVVDDASLTLLTADSVEEAAEAVALLLPRLADKGSTLLVRATPSLVLEDALARFHQPATGHAPVSRWRSILQLLPLCLRMRWEPRSMQTLLDFLLLPDAPVRWQVRRRLVTALQEFPGIGNEAWEEQVASAQDFLCDVCGDMERGKEQWNEALQWLLPATVPETSGMPQEVVEEVCTRLATWARRQARQKKEGVPFAVLAAQVDDFAAMARAAAESRFSRPTLETMLDCALGAACAFSSEEAAPWQVIEHPGQLHGPVDTLLWWQFRHPGTRNRQFWTLAERQWLEGQGCKLDDPLTEHRLQDLAWQRALGLTRKRCLLVLPRRENGEEVPPHPLWEHMVNAFAGDEAARVLTRSAPEVLAQAGVPLVAVNPKEAACERDTPLKFAPQPLPENISYTQAQNAVHCSFHGLLTQRLQPQGPEGVNVPEAQRLRGTFSHYLLQRLLVMEPLPEAQKAAAVMAEMIASLLPTHAATLLEERHALAREDFIRRMCCLAESLVHRITAMGMRGAQVEYALERQLPGRDCVLQGRADVCWPCPEGTSVIWDLKWSFDRKKYLDQLLDKDTGDQLAAYAWMHGGTVAAAYWLLPLDAFMGTEGSGAEGAEVHASDLRTKWTAMADTLESRFAAWEQGEAGLTPWENRDKDIPRNCKYCELGFVCGRKYV